AVERAALLEGCGELQVLELSQRLQPQISLKVRLSLQTVAITDLPITFAAAVMSASWTGSFSRWSAGRWEVISTSYATRAARFNRSMMRKSSAGVAADGRRIACALHTPGRARYPALN